MGAGSGAQADSIEILNSQDGTLDNNGLGKTPQTDTHR